jgi:FkbM family methyltransferase
MRLGGIRIPEPDFVKASREEFFRYPEAYSSLRERLADDSSRRVFDDIMLYRLTCDTACTSSYACDNELQYFDSIIKLSAHECLVDCGAYQGETSEQFLERTDDTASCYLFEPCPSNLGVARDRLSRFKNVSFHAAGLSDRSERRRFHSAAGLSSRVADSGDIEVDLLRIDDIVSKKCTYIKMDIEGHELLALKGAETTIQRFHPKLAIACYHTPDHIWKIPDFVLSLRKDYKLYLRHYSEGWADTVMYFIPT